MRSHRADFAKRIRQSIFEICKVPPITTKASALKIADWKQSPQVIAAYQSLWKSENGELLNINRILTKALPKNEKFTCNYTAYVLAVCTVLLDPKGKNIKLDDESLKKRIRIFMVYYLISRLDFLYL